MVDFKEAFGGLYLGKKYYHQARSGKCNRFGVPAPEWWDLHTRVHRARGSEYKLKNENVPLEDDLNLGKKSLIGSLWRKETAAAG